MKRISLSLDDEVVKNLTMASRRLGYSRSAFVNMILLESTPIFERVLQMIPENPEEFDAKRFRGDSIDLLTDQYRNLLQEVMLFPDDKDEGQ